MSLTNTQLEKVFSDTVLAEDSNLSASFSQGQDLYFAQKATCQIVSTATQENEQFENNIFPASSSNTFLSKHAASLGIPNITGAQPTVGTLTLSPPDGSPANPTVNFSIPMGSILTNPATAIQYQVSMTCNFTTSDPFVSIPIPIQSVLSGSNTYCSPGTILNFSAPLMVGSVTISNAIANNDIVSGYDTPTNLDISELVSSYMQNPRGGGSQGDYFRWAKESTPLITFAKIIPAGYILDQNLIYIAAFTGSGDPNVNIGLSFPISRSVTLPTVNVMKAYIEGVRPINDQPIYATVSTYAITDNDTINPSNPNPSITLNVLLAVGLSLNTVIQGSNGMSMTVEDWIKYQTRYAILSAPYGGTTLDDNQPYILGDDIITLIKSGLSASSYLQGYLCSLLINVTFRYDDDTHVDSINIPVPDSNNYFIAALGNIPASLKIIYDLDTTIITINQVT